MKLFEDLLPVSGEEKLIRPKGYTGLHAFHKYWGKKPLEVLAFLIEHLTAPQDLVMDPFTGSGTAGVEALRLNRRFIGFDLNPIAIKLTGFQLDPPSLSSVAAAFHSVEKETKSQIMETYHSPQFSTPATHYLWEGGTLREVWDVKRGKNGRNIYKPTQQDLSLFQEFQQYQPNNFRLPVFFSNSRINAKSDLLVSDIFTGRALRNIDVLLGVIQGLPESERNSLLLALTAAVGQMSKMVFAITGRGKTTGDKSEKTEVGSWVIGFWRPHLHFEINVWTCFENKVKKMMPGLANTDQSHRQKHSSIVRDVLQSSANYSVQQGDAVTLMEDLPEHCVDLIVTDPPHGDRQPYLELSELWNALLNAPVDFSKEIVVSDAAERRKSVEEYNVRMKHFFHLAASKIKPTGVLALLFNASDSLSWEFLVDCRETVAQHGMDYLGCFPAKYSALSVVQDNREGSLKHDYILLFSSNPVRYRTLCDEFPGWSKEMPIPDGK
jgi:hypothetical protein